MAQIKSYVKVVSFPEPSVLSSEMPKVYWVYQLRMCGRNLHACKLRSIAMHCLSPKALEVYLTKMTSVYKYWRLKNLVMA